MHSISKGGKCVPSVNVILTTLTFWKRITLVLSSHSGCTPQLTGEILNKTSVSFPPKANWMRISGARFLALVLLKKIPNWFYSVAVVERLCLKNKSLHPSLILSQSTQWKQRKVLINSVILESILSDPQCSLDRRMGAWQASSVLHRLKLLCGISKSSILGKLAPIPCI